MAHYDYFRINISIADMHRLAARILDVINAFQNFENPIYERVCVGPPPYYLDWFGNFYPNIPLNRDEDNVFLWCMNGIQGGGWGGSDNNVINFLMQWLQF